jgi:hypothetical protein
MPRARRAARGVVGLSCVWSCPPHRTAYQRYLSPLASCVSGASRRHAPRVPRSRRCTISHDHIRNACPARVARHGRHLHKHCAIPAPPTRNPLATLPYTVANATRTRPASRIRPSYTHPCVHRISIRAPHAPTQKSHLSNARPGRPPYYMSTHHHTDCAQP